MINKIRRNIRKRLPLDLGRNCEEHGISFSDKTPIPPESQVSPWKQQSWVCTAAFNIWTNLLNHLKPHHPTIYKKLILNFYICKTFKVST